MATITDRPPRAVAFVDIETTGLDPDKHELIEVAYVLEPEGLERNYSLPVTLKDASEQALAINRFYQRRAELRDRRVTHEWLAARVSGELSGRLFVANNPAFDAGFLSALLCRFGLPRWPWHYHLVDVKALVAGKLGIAPPWGTADLMRRASVSAARRHEALADAHITRALYRFAVADCS